MLAQTEIDVIPLMVKYFGGGAAAAGVIAAAFLREWIVTGAAFRRAIAERDEWKAMALRSLEITQASQSNTSQATKVAGMVLEKAGSGNAS